MLRLRGDFRPGEFDEAHAAILEAERRAIRVRVAGEERLAAAEDAGRYRDALGAMPPGGLPDVFLEPVTGALASLVQRWARGRGPFTTAEAAAWFGQDVEPVLRELERAESLVRGELRPGGSEREWCDPEVLRRLRRASLAALRREVEPVEQAALGRFLPGWHGIGRRASLREALIPLQGLALPVGLWESEVLPRRVPDYRPEQLDQLCASGELVWVGAGLDRVALFFREDAALLGAPPAAPRSASEVHEAIRRALDGRALFWAELIDEAQLDGGDAIAAVWDLVWAGEVTNDAWAPLRADRRYESGRRGRQAADRRTRRFSRVRATRATATQGRWSPAPALFAGGETDRRALAELLLERQGIVTRDSVRAEGISGGFGAVYGELRALETLGPAGGATSSRGWVARSSLSGVQWSGCASFVPARRRNLSRSCWPQPTPRSRTGRAGLAEARRARGRHELPVRTSSFSEASRPSSSSAADARSFRSATRDRRGCGRP